MVGDIGRKRKGGSKNLNNIRPDGLAKIIASLMMDNFKKRKKTNTLENPESQPKIVRKNIQLHK